MVAGGELADVDVFVVMVGFGSVLESALGEDAVAVVLALALALALVVAHVPVAVAEPESVRFEKKRTRQSAFLAHCSDGEGHREPWGPVHRFS